MTTAASSSFLTFTAMKLDNILGQGDLFQHLFELFSNYTSLQSDMIQKRKYVGERGRIERDLFREKPYMM